MLISKKVGLLVVIAMATSAAVSSFGLYGLQRVNTHMVDIAGNSVPALMRVSEMRSAYLALIPQLYNRATTSDPEKGQVYDKAVDEGTSALFKRLTEYAETVSGDEERQALEEAKRSMNLFVARVRLINAQADVGDTEGALAMVQRDIGPLHERLSRSFDALVKISTGNVNALADAASEAFKRTLAVTISAAIVGVVVIGIMGFLLGRSIARPLGVMQRAIIRTASELDFTDSVEVKSKDEVGATLQAYNELLARLRSSFSDIQAVSARMSTITGDVDRTSKEIAENSQQQSDASSGMAAAIQQLTVSISMVASQAQDASVHTQDSRHKADVGAEVILNTVRGIQTISDSVREASARIDALRHDSESISSVANIIKEIADQTNLLALNAAIEAARAGEQGRGFAVVADEVRKLAERTSKSTQEISTLLSQMQGSAKQAVDTMAAVVREVEVGVQNAKDAGSSINEIKDGSGTVVSAVEEITEAVREQSAASTSISQRIEQIAQMTERNTAAAGNTADAVHRLSEMSREIESALKAYKV